MQTRPPVPVREDSMEKEVMDGDAGMVRPLRAMT